MFGVYKEKAIIYLKVFGEFKELIISSGQLAPFTYATALELMHRGLINGDACGTHNFSLEDSVQALDCLPEEDELQIEVVFNPSSAA
ncbi:MAG: hypothetical protein P8M25_04630 [Paracoccaceae bacterium]|nr:hypothetical protein [Paracoccaceae bacterium]